VVEEDREVEVVREREGVIEVVGVVDVGVVGHSNIVRMVETHVQVEVVDVVVVVLVLNDGRCMGRTVTMKKRMRTKCVSIVRSLLSCSSPLFPTCVVKCTYHRV
jgi:hypothetical protein